jgi:predicted nucleic acid-binding protein
MKYLFDTSIITELISTQPNPNLIAFVDSLDQADIYLSAITVGEIAKGIHLLPNSNRKRELDAWLRENLLVRFEGRILPLDADLFIRWGEFSAKLELVEAPPIAAFDSLIAATAWMHKMVLVTNNEDDYNNTGLEIVNPW